MIDEKDFLEFIKPAIKNFPKLLDLEDVGRQAVIKEVGFAETKYGRKLRILLDVEGEEKSLLLGKSLARSLYRSFENRGIPTIKDWIGKRVKVERVVIQSRNGIIEKPVITPQL